MARKHGRLDIRFIPEQDALFRAIPKLKESLSVNIELASPADFLPELPGWETRSRFIAREGRVSSYHYDFYSEALFKIERGHEKEVLDVQEMIARELIIPEKALELFEAIQPGLFRFTAVDPKKFREKVEFAFAR